MKSVYLIEDHDEALAIWRKERLRGLNLIHVDAHMDFSIHQARPMAENLYEAKSLSDLKRSLEISLAYLKYEKKFARQINIGNYIYPAMREGIVKNFYWIIPGGRRDFTRSKKIIRRILLSIVRSSSPKEKVTEYRKRSIMAVRYMGGEIRVSTLAELPTLHGETLLDIDVDFMVIDSLPNADPTSHIGKRFPWISPEELVDILKRKVPRPRCSTIAYSTNGGYTPMAYRHFGDELAFALAPHLFKRRHGRAIKASWHYSRFLLTGERREYLRAIKLDRSYRRVDNNFGPQYLALSKFAQAEREFKNILKVDLKNGDCISGLGYCAIGKRDFGKAKRLFVRALRIASFGDIKLRREVLPGLARAEYNLGNFRLAEKHLLLCVRQTPLDPEPYHFLGLINEKKKRYPYAAAYYKNAIQLGITDPAPLFRLFKLSCHLKEKEDIILYIKARYVALERGWRREKTMLKRSVAKAGSVKRFDEKIRALGRALNKKAVRT